MTAASPAPTRIEYFGRLQVHQPAKPQEGSMSTERDEANAEAIQHAQEVCAETLRDLPDDTELDVAFAEFKRRLGVTR